MIGTPVPGTMQDPVQCSAVAAFAEYCRLRAAGGGPPVPRSKENSSLPSKGFARFYGLAEMCLGKGWNAVEYVREVFANCSDKPLFDVCGKDLVSSKAVDFYAKRQATGAPNEYVLVWYCAEDVLKHIRKSPLYNGIPTSDILANLSLNQFPDWFRLLYPWPPETKLCELFDMDVLADIQNDRKLHQALLTVCPAQLEGLFRRTLPNYSKGNESNE